MTNITNNWHQVQNDVHNHALQCGRSPENIIILAVSKTHSTAIISEGIKAGIQYFGENYAQEFRDKYSEISLLPIQQPSWHFIGHIQTNKVKYIVPFCSLIHTVDSVRLAEEIGKISQKNNRKTSILLQINTSGELSKSGIAPNDVHDIVEKIQMIDGISIEGLMCIPAPEEENAIREEFRQLCELRNTLIQKYPQHSWHHLSMGMSSDYHIAIEEGATIIRIGTAIFGQR